jgi:hypothetical protein
VRSRGAWVKCTIGGISEVVEVNGMLQGQRRRRALSEVVEVEGEAIERHQGHAPGVKRSRARSVGGGMLRALVASRRSP